MANLVLFLDDDSALLTAFSRVFRREPFRMLMATDTAAARETLRRHAVDVLVCDYTMPGVSGTAFLAEVRATHPDVIPIMLTGSSDVGVAADAIAFAGVFRFFSKPCHPDTLAQAIRMALARKEVIRASRRLLRDTMPTPSGGQIPARRFAEPTDGVIELDDAPIDLDALVRELEALDGD